MIDGNYKIRLVGDGKDSVLKNGQPNRAACFSNGDVMPANSAQFVVINPPYLAPVADPLPPNTSNAPKMVVMSCKIWLIIFAKSILVHVIYSI